MLSTPSEQNLHQGAKTCAASYFAVALDIGAAARARVGEPSERQVLTPQPTQTERSDMHDIHVTVVSPEEASYGTAEFWSGGRMIGFTRLEDGDLMLRMEAGVVVGVHSLSGAIAEANRLLSLY